MPPASMLGSPARSLAPSLRLASQKLCTVTGIDINEGMLGVARNNSQVEWHQGSATAMPFADGSFDLVLCQQGLQYFRTAPQPCKRWLGSLFRAGDSRSASGVLTNDSHSMSR
jgi:ubiquinone/menaquinone biosynthesis C-methylase UbiE